MDKGILGQYHVFLRSAAGIDLVERLKTTEAKYMMEGMKSSTMEAKALSMAKMEATYSIRTMLDDLSKPAKSASDSSGHSK